MKPVCAVLTLVALAGCDSLSGAETRFPGMLVRNDRNVETLAAPDTVFSGRPFTITVVTAGGGCFQKGDAELDVDLRWSAQAAEVRPFDVFVDPGPGPAGACTADLVYFEHSATVTFGRPGTATLRAVGTGEGHGFGPPPADAPLVTVERTVVVLPQEG